METITLTLEQYLTAFPEPDHWNSSSPTLKTMPEKHMIHTLYGNCNFKGPEINIGKVCKKVVTRSQKALLPKPYLLVYVASRLIQKAPLLTYKDAFELVMWHMVNELNSRYKAEKIPLQVELGEQEKKTAGLTSDESEEHEYYDGIAQQLKEAEVELSELYKQAGEGFSEAYNHEIPECSRRIEELQQILANRDNLPM